MNRKLRKQFAQALALGMACTGATAAVNARRRSRRDYRVFILDYHEVTAGPGEPEGVVTAARFKSHIGFLKKHFEIVSLTEAVAHLADGKSLHHDLLVITLDDGYAGNYHHAFAALRAEGISATVFVATGFVDGKPLWTDLARRALASARASELPASLADRFQSIAPGWRQGLSDPVEALKRLAPSNRDELLARLVETTGTPDNLAAAMTWQQIAEMAAAGIEIGCHTVSHPILPTLSASEQRREIEQSRDRIAEKVGVTPTVFAYPNGDFDEASVAALRELGFEAACTTRRGSNVPGCDRFRLARIGIGSDSNHLVAARLTGIFDQERRERLGSMGLVRSTVAHA